MGNTSRLDKADSNAGVSDRRRHALEVEMIAEADAEIAAGLTIDEAEVDAWIDSLGTTRELPKPRPGR